MELRPIAAQGEAQHTPLVNVLGSLSDAADQSPESLLVTLEALYLRHMAVGPRILSVEPCRFFLSGCWRSKDCRFSHLPSESEASIKEEFERYPIDPSTARLASLLVRRARNAGLTAPGLTSLKSTQAVSQSKRNQEMETLVESRS